VFARMVQSLWKDLGEVRAQYACKQADPVPSGGTAPLSSSVCKKLASAWSLADLKIGLCINEFFDTPDGNSYGICDYARDLIEAFGQKLPAAATGPDVYNRLGELRSRVEVMKHIWDERFVKSLKAAGFCRERGTCPP
jgi:hypothetical protein